MHVAYPIPQKKLTEALFAENPVMRPYVEGGKYVDELGLDMTGLWVAGSRIRAYAQGIEFDEVVSEPSRIGRRVCRINIMRKNTGWQWDSHSAAGLRTLPENMSLDDLDRLVSIEVGKFHWYCLAAVVTVPMLLDRRMSATEPRLRPLIYTSAQQEFEQVGSINLRGRLHCVYSIIRIV